MDAVVPIMTLNTLPPGVTARRQAMRLVQKVSQLGAGSITGVQDGDPTLGRIERMREEYVGRCIVELGLTGRLGRRRISQQPLETTPTDRDVDPEDAVAIKVGLGVPTCIVMDDDSDERESLILRQIALGVIEEERVTPSRGGRAALLTRGQGHNSGEAADVIDDLCLSHAAMITLRPLLRDLGVAP